MLRLHLFVFVPFVSDIRDELQSPKRLLSYSKKPLMERDMEGVRLSVCVDGAASLKIQVYLGRVTVVTVLIYCVSTCRLGKTRVVSRRDSKKSNLGFSRSQ